MPPLIGRTGTVCDPALFLCPVSLIDMHRYLMVMGAMQILRCLCAGMESSSGRTGACVWLNCKIIG